MFSNSQTMAFRARRSLALRSLLALIVALVLVGIASAHVTVNPREVPADTSQIFAVRVPTEKEEATVQVRLVFPATLTVSRFQPKPGWEREVVKDGSGRITEVTWSGGEIAPGEFEEFIFQARTPKEPGPLTFQAYQTYAGGEEVAWVNGAEEDQPAPIVQVVAASGAAGEDSHGAATGGTTGGTTGGVAQSSVQLTAQPAGSSTTAATTPAASEGSDLPLFVALTALVASLLALALAGVSFARGRRT